MKAGLNMLSQSTLLGVGAGHYQSNIGTNFSGLPKFNTAEPNQYNGYIIIASTLGLLGLLSCIWIFGATIAENLRTYSLDRKLNSFKLGLIGCFVSMSIENLFSYLFISSLLVPIVLFLCLSLRNMDDGTKN
ncbi:MAG: hypothetical protein EOO43_14565 [Flavobacterium sp.]|nr:MAG: hypothetical protein EOO43_14565 [Flavobacterium sp.]